jgi:hypothetical protein
LVANRDEAVLIVEVAVHHEIGELRKAAMPEIHRINFFGGLEETAHYTTSLQDCLEKGADKAQPARRRPEH